MKNKIKDSVWLASLVVVCLWSFICSRNNRRQSNEEDLYAILGVDKNATQEEIMKRYKKLAKIYHPDKSHKDPKESEAKMMKINKAKEILGDPKKRQIYDRGGEEAVNNHEQGGHGEEHFHSRGGGMNINIEDILNAFGGGGGGFGGFGGFGGGGQQRQRQQYHQGGNQQRRSHRPEQEHEETETPKFNFEEISQAIIITETTLPDFTKLTDVFLLYLYDRNSQYGSKSIYIKNFLEKYGSVVRIGVLNCSKEKELCQRMKPDDIPVLYLYLVNGKRVQIDLRDGYGPEFLVNKIIQNMGNNIVKLREFDFNKFVIENFGKPVILLFTNRTSPSILSMSLANQLKGHVVVAEISITDKLAHLFKVRESGKIMLMTDPIHYTGIMFDGKNTKEAILRFINSSAFAQGKPVKNFEKPFEFSLKRYSHGHCGPTDNILCFIYCSKSSQLSKEETESIDSLMKKYSRDGLSFYVLHSNHIDHEKFTTYFEDSNLLLVKGKRSKVRKMTVDIVRDVTLVDKAIESIVSGSLASMTRLDHFEEVLK